MNINRAIISVGGGAFISCGVFIGLILVPQFRGLVADKRELFLSREGELVQERGAVAEMIRSRREGLLPALEGVFVPEDAPLPFIEFLEESGRTLSSFQIVPGKSQKLKEDPWPSLSFRIEAVGSYSAVSAFIERIETAPYLVEVVEVSLSAAKDRNISLLLLVKAYLR